MPERIYNTFYKQIQQDDYLTNGANFIEGNNLTGLRTGYGLTLSQKPVKQLETTELMRGVLERSGTSLNLNYPYGEAGEIYRLTSTDNIPEYTLTNGYDILNAISGPSNYFFSTQSPGLANLNIAQISRSDADDGNWVGNINENFILGMTSNKTPAMLKYGSVVYIGAFGRIDSISNSLVVTTFSGIVSGTVIGLTLSGTTIKVYNDDGNIQFWDGVSASFTSSIDLGFRIRRVVSVGTTDYITSEDGDFYVMSGYSSQRLIRATQSNRLNDNSQYFKKLTFETGEYDNQTLEHAKGDIFLLSGDSIKSVYQYGNLIEGLPKGMSNVITKNHLEEEFEELTSLKYIDQPQNLYITHSSVSGNYVDVITLDNLETAKDGYAVTDVFTGGTTFSKQIDKFRITTSDTSGDNFIKLYFRKNNAATWTLARTINNATNTIDRKSITEVTGDFIDIQFKVELHNDNQDDTPPLLHELYLEYTINKNNG